MKYSATLLAGVAALGLMVGAARATDLGDMVEPATGGDWDGLYAGLLVGQWDSPYIDVQGVVGVNFLPSEVFLLGIEGSLGGYISTNGGTNGFEGEISARAGVVVGKVLLFAGAGEWVDLSSGGGLYPYFSAGAEFKATDNIAIRAQVQKFQSGSLLGQVGVLWQMD